MTTLYDDITLALAERDARIAALEAALRKIASCEKRTDGDVVDIARTTLKATANA